MNEKEFNELMQEAESDLHDGPTFEVLVLVELRGIARSLRTLVQEKVKS
jgi:hypothetical protein